LVRSVADVDLVQGNELLAVVGAGGNHRALHDLP